MTHGVFVKELEAPEINEKELLRYAGIRDSAIPTPMLEIIESFKDIFSYRVVYTRLPVSIKENKIDTGILKVTSKTLSRALLGCDSVYLVAATVGSAFDRKLSALSVTSPARAQILDSFGTERVETLLDAFTKELINESKEVPTPRVSAGYGDIPLSLQRDIFRALEPEKRIALYLNESLLMTPMKSVTAFIGVKKDK